MADFDRHTASATAPGYDGAAEVMRQREAAVRGLINGEATATAMAAADAGAGGTLANPVATATPDQFGQLHQQW
ncbi:MAG TPA: hypothetical protein VD969_00850 [Symbiobacteriaceae bacterium]|nr:hypothetical protein [Symbiobacteriaceae bacterium]